MAKFSTPAAPCSMLRLLGAALLAATGAGCAPLQTEGLRVLESPPAEHPPAYGELAFRSGQLAVSDARSPLNLLIALLPQHYHRFTHIGLIEVVDGTAWLYEAQGRLSLLPGSGPPTDRISGAVRRIPLAELVRRNGYVEVYDPPPGLDVTAALVYARRQMELGTPFDPYFDETGHAALYCSEFVALALHAGGQPLAALLPSRSNPSLRRALDWLGVRAHGSWQPGTLVAGGRHVATLSSDRTRSQAALHFAVREELHRRFTADQRIGYVFRWTGQGLALRAPVAEFVSAAEHLVDRNAAPPAPARLRRQVRALANAHFGRLRPAAPVALGSGDTAASAPRGAAIPEPDDRRPDHPAGGDPALPQNLAPAAASGGTPPFRGSKTDF